MATVYSASMYGRGGLFVTPAADEPRNECWYKATPGENGGIVREPIQFFVRFDRGAAEVDDELACYLLGKNLVTASPPRSIPRPHADMELETIGRPQYATPIPVGRPLTPEGAEPTPVQRSTFAQRVARLFTGHQE